MQATHCCNPHLGVSGVEKIMIELKKEQAALIWGPAKQYASTHEVMRVFLGGIVFRNLTTGRYCVGYNYCMRSATFADIDDCIASIG